MYCAQCGVKLADSETSCPLCGTRAYHPDIPRGTGEKSYPSGKYPKAPKRSLWLQGLCTALFLLPMLIVLLCDLQISGAVTWSGYVIGALLLGYITLILPSWFRRPNPVIFVPCSFLAAGLYLAYINHVTAGNWFLTLAFPITAGIGLTVTAVVTLTRYLRRGRLFIFGGAFMTLGLFMLPMEFLVAATFRISFIGWSLYPLVTLLLLGGMLIFLGICRPARESMERKFFI